MRIKAPYPTHQQIIQLPEPELGDDQLLQKVIQNRRAMDNTRYTYIKQTLGQSIYNWSFNLTRMKALEFRDFFESYVADKWEVTSGIFTGAILGYITTNPFEMNGFRRATYCPNDARGSHEMVTISITFESDA